MLIDFSSSQSFYGLGLTVTAMGYYFPDINKNLFNRHIKKPLDVLKSKSAAIETETTASNLLSEIFDCLIKSEKKLQKQSIKWQKWFTGCSIINLFSFTWTSFNAPLLYIGFENTHIITQMFSCTVLVVTVSSSLIWIPAFYFYKRKAKKLYKKTTQKITDFNRCVATKKDMPDCKPQQEIFEKINQILETCP